LSERRKILINEKKAADELLTQLKDENTKLRIQQKMYSEENAKKRYQLLIQLQKQVSESCPDDQLCQTLQEIKKCCNSCKEIGKCNLQSIVNPGAVQQLIQAGFFENITLDLQKKGTAEEFVAKLRSELGKTLTREQESKIEQAIYDHNEKLSVIVAEREVVSSTLNNTFRAFQIGLTPGDPKDSKEIISGLEHLRKSLTEESKLWTETMQRVLDETLTPIQLAHFYLRVEFQHRSVVQLNTFWNALNQTLHTNIKSEGCKKESYVMKETLTPQVCQ